MRRVVVVVDDAERGVVVDAADVDGNGVPDAVADVDFASRVVFPDTPAIERVVAPSPSTTRRALTLRFLEVPGSGLLPVGLRERDAELVYGDEDDVGCVAPAHDGFEGFAVKDVVVRYDARPFTDDDAVAIGAVDGPVAAAAVAAVADGHVVVSDVGADVAHVRVVDEFGHAWNLWTRRPIDVAAPAGAASVSSYVLDDDDEFAVNNDGGLAHVAAVTRVPLP